VDDLCKLTARQAVSLLKEKKVSPLELIDAASGRIAETDGAINAISTLCLERARKHARALMTSPSPDPSPAYLYGLPIAVKDLTDVGGVRTTYGSILFANHVPKHSNYVVETLERNGAIVIGKSNTPEFGAGATTFNEVFGRTYNPWDTQMTPGGSSGGSAAALAAGQVWLATGTDLGGSIRIPSSYCSIVGLRPSPGRVAYGPDELPFDTLRVHGPMARTVGDVALMLDAQVGQHPDDPLSFPAPNIPFISSVDYPARPRRIAFSPNLGGLAPVEAEVREICTKGALSFGDMGTVVEEACPDLHDAEEIFQILRAAFMATYRGPLLESHRNSLKPELVWNIEKGLELTPSQIGRAERARGELYHRTVSFFHDFDLLLSPAVVAPPFDARLRYLKEVEGVTFDTYVGWLVLAFAITLTACPAISVPCGFTAKGLPVGLQIVGPPRGETKVLSAAALLEEHEKLSNCVPIDPRVRPGPFHCN